ncbi:putative pentatricopeptide repeat-containing protein At3g16710, mitochondrial [Pistacia vera]|uniref:putative pentatricopeptide repeat-containing protein At3g16710, mitochondrial n=1 Tax=Pistacia vera TaxID=55513 RepID=UPI00126344C0|nr:putative pentatricopeptide repeat-containing protein At3g16710, mitochondrial [Pistacia vera]
MLHPIAKYVACNKLSNDFLAFTTNLSAVKVPAPIHEALGDENWRKTVIEEMEALRLRRWRLLDLGAGEFTWRENNCELQVCVMELFKKMAVIGVKPDIVSYGSIVNGLCKDGLVDKTKELFLEMKSGGIKPNMVVFTTLIYGCCFVRNLEGTKGLFFEMLDQGLHPNLLTYNTMMGFTRRGRWRKLMGCWN